MSDVEGSAHANRMIEELALAVLVALALGGVAISDFSAISGLAYWSWIVPVFAAASVFAGWQRALRKGEAVPPMLVQQLLHWIPLPVVFYVVYQLEQTGRLNRADAGLVALLALSLTTLLAGVHFDRRLAVPGLLLAVAAIGAALVEEYLWALLLPTLVAGIGFWVWQRRR